MYDRKLMLRLLLFVFILLSLTMTTIMFSGCNTAQKKEPRVYNIDSLDCDYVVYVIDSCEYIIFNSGSSTWGSHKGDCSNPIHLK